MAGRAHHGQLFPVAVVVPQLVYTLLAGLFEHAPHPLAPAAALNVPVKHCLHFWIEFSCAVPVGLSVPAAQGVHDTMAVPLPSQRVDTPWCSAHDGFSAWPSQSRQS